ncbi:PEP/pyruvate-binding domain-containing protein [[Mycobacterium] holstebronense]|uniref:PEP/pyruvate-binding domain-containing protein n=1 Tax=[Mycobacterium] holstebronense TaxID=3064288 RepID=A0ABN9NCQ9_9MYCO|nr:PEP/pyruvate-binding domain-containing protein [Mycolicibacter sp. MU0102]CAJ1502836.1 PEP/pyruvate-binding domain-containing protein [Mycolicibacter sp. MU0102]
MSATFVKPLSDIRATDVAFSGGKGANLGELLAVGLPVPDGFVIGVSAHVDLSGELRDAIVANYHALGDDTAVAVRSSAVAEDGVDASHAGIYETVLNVRGITQLLAAVDYCWESASSARARRYRDARGLESTVGMAVVVQRQIVPTCGGVAFTADPLSGDRDRVVIELARGHGESVVDGSVTPESIVVDKISLNRADSEARLALSDKKIRNLVDCAIRIEQWYGRPQDIEWVVDEHGQIWILQTRPITTGEALQARAKAAQFYDPPRATESRWTRVNIAEAVPGVPTPLSWSMWRTGLTEAQRQTQIQLGVVSKRESRQGPLLTLAQGWPVLSVDLLLSQVARVPGVDPSAFSQQLLGEAEHIDMAPKHARAVTACRMAFRAPVTLALLNRRLRAVSATSRQAWQRDAWRRADDPLALLVGAATRFGETLTIHTMQTYLCQSLYQAVERVAGDLVIELLSGDGDLPEAHLARDLCLLSGGAISLDRFLREHGFHGPDEGEIGSASWRQNPEPVLQAARTWADGGSVRDPGAALARRRDERVQAESELRALLPRARRGAVTQLIALARRALVGREIGKTAFLQDLDVARHAVSFIDAAAVWRTLDELRGSAVLSSADVLARQRVRSRFATQEPPLSFVCDPNSAPVASAVGEPPLITGAAASPGRVRGRARVVTNPNAIVELGDDDVLIARTTDPSWVVRFMAVAGMAIDVGGTLSHAAIIARELGIPCVIGTGNGTQVIPDGAWLDLDGSQGTVKILDEPPTDRSGIA